MKQAVAFAFALLLVGTLAYSDQIQLYDNFEFAENDEAAAGFTFSPNFANAITVGVTSGWIYVTASAYPNGTTITITPTYGSAPLTFTPASLIFNSTYNIASFRWSATQVGSWPVNFTISGDTIAQFTAIPVQTATTVVRSVTVDGYPSGGFIVGIPSEPLQLSITVPSLSPLTFTPVIAATANAVTLGFSSVTIAPNSLTASIVITSYQPFNFQQLNIQWYPSAGNDAALYANGSQSGFVGTSLRSLSYPLFSSVTVNNNGTTQLIVVPGTRPNGTLTIEPSAVDTFFTPPTVALNASTPYASFNLSTTSVQNNRIVNYFLGGDPGVVSNYTAPSQGSIGAPYKTVLTDFPTQYWWGSNATASVRLPYPATGNITVSIFASNLAFNPSTFTFIPGAPTSVLVTVAPLNVGPDTINFLLSGPDMAYYSPISNIYNVNVAAGTFTQFILPTLYVGVTSDPLNVYVNVAPVTNVTLTPFAENLVFSPSTFLFTPNNLEVSFTITPTGASTSIAENNLVSYAVGGGDWSLFGAPNPLSVSINRRSFQFVWSSDVTAGGFPYTLYVQKTYSVWASTNYVNPGETVTFTPYSPYITFNPSTITFTNGNLRQLVQAVPTTAYGNTAFINFAIGGSAGGFYTGLNAQTFTSVPRPVTISNALIAWDDRSAAVLVNQSNSPQPLAAYLANATNHIFAVTFSTTVIPNSRLTITPIAAHISFSPSSIDFVPDGWLSSLSVRGITSPPTYPSTVDGTDYIMVGNFTVTPKAAGTHEVYLQLSGPDAPYYASPGHFSINFRPYLGASAQVTVSIVGVAFVALLVLIL